MDTVELGNRFAYHAPKDEATVKAHEAIRNYTLDLAVAFNVLLPEGRDKSLAITKLEEAMFWANAAIARS